MILAHEILRKKLYRATCIMRIIQVAESRISVRKAYNDNPEWAYLYPQNCRDNIMANIKTRIAIKRLHKAYIKVINEIVEINNKIEL